ncbi:MAG TPA: hypothetical protein VFY39_17750, partial [Gammaproteobacteria bacterium]|nr:hypothetical protein [Gammaproteobacteria bacterium]
MPSFDRREFLGATFAAAGSLVLWPQLTRASTGDDTRFLLVLLRGGLDGLAAVPPYGDPAYSAIRGALALSPEGAAPAHKLDDTFALHPSLAYASRLYAEGQLMPLVAVAPPYWGRSHFDAQDCLENGTPAPHGAQDGWLNRCVAAMPGAEGLSVAAVMPLAMRGAGSVSSWSPPLPAQVNPILLQRLQPLYAADAALAEAFTRAVDEQQDAPMSPGLRQSSPGKKAKAGQLSLLMAAAGGFMAAPAGPRIGFVEDNGWDTHANEANILERKLAELDAGIQ